MQDKPEGSPVSVVEAPPIEEAVSSTALQLAEHSFTDVAARAAPSLQLVDPLADAMHALTQVLELADVLVKTGFMPKSCTTREKAAAIILTGREMGIAPMQAIRSINIVDGRPIIAADLQLSLFKKAGGRSQWLELTEERAVLMLRHPNGDTHTESFTWADATAAQLTGKENWKKYRKAMLRSRVISAGLKSLGFEPLAGVYTPDEAESFDNQPLTAEPTRTTPRAPEVTRTEPRAVQQHEGGSVTSTQQQAPVPDQFEQDGPVIGERMGAPWTAPSNRAPGFPYGPLKGIPLNAKYDEGAMRTPTKGDKTPVPMGGMYVCNAARIGEAIDWANQKLDLDLAAQESQEGSDPKNKVDADKRAFLSAIVTDCTREQQLRLAEKAQSDLKAHQEGKQSGNVESAASASASETSATPDGNVSSAQPSAEQSGETSTTPMMTSAAPMTSHDDGRSAEG